jgi:hypothetical protein
MLRFDRTVGRLSRRNIIFQRFLPAARWPLAFAAALFFMGVSAAPAAAQKYAQLLPGEGRYAAFTYVKYGSLYESFFNRDFATAAVRILNRLADAQKNCDHDAWVQAKKSFVELENIVFVGATSAPSQTNKNARYEAQQDYLALVRLSTNIPRWRPCKQKTRAQPPPAPPRTTPQPPPPSAPPWEPPEEDIRPSYWTSKSDQAAEHEQFASPWMTLPSRFCSQEEKNEYIHNLDFAADSALERSSALLQYDRQMIQALQRATAVLQGSQLQQATQYYQGEESWALEQAEALHKLSNRLHSLALAARRIPVEKCDGVGYMPGGGGGGGLRVSMAAGPGVQLLDETIKSDTEKDTLRLALPSYQLYGQVNYQPWYLSGLLAFSLPPFGTLTESFPGFSSSYDANSGLLSNFEGKAGYNFYQTWSTRISVFGQLDWSGESFFGVPSGGSTLLPLLSEDWLAGGIGFRFDQSFSLGNVPLTFSGTISGLFDSLHSSGFNGTGPGFQVGGLIGYDFGPVDLQLWITDTYLTASGSGVRDNNNEVGIWTRVGFKLWAPEAPQP